MQYAPVPRAGRTPNRAGEGADRRRAGARRASGLFELYYLFPLTAEQQTIALDPAHRPARRHRAGRARPGHRAARHPAGRAPGAGGGRDGRPARGRRPVPADQGARHRRPGPAGPLVQRHGRQPAAADPPAGGSVPAAAPVHQRRLARAAHAADHDPDGGRVPATRSRDDFPPELTRAAELLHDRARPVRVAARPTCWRSPATTPAWRTWSPRPLDIRGVVASTVEANRLLAERHGSELVVDAAGTPVTVDMDPRRVERILRNLVGNALDHGEGKPVVITVGYDDDAVAVTVRDHGVGLRPGQAGLVFNRFWRGDPSRSRLTGGTGLGLAICARGRPAARRLAAGLGRAGPRRAVPAHPAAPGRAHADPLAAAARSRRDRGGGRMRRGIALGSALGLLGAAAAPGGVHGRAVVVIAARSSQSLQLQPPPPQRVAPAAALTRARSSSGFLRHERRRRRRTSSARDYLTTRREATAGTTRPRPIIDSTQIGNFDSRHPDRHRAS